MSWQQTNLYFLWQTFKHGSDAARRVVLRSYYPRWKASFQPGHNSMTDENPWINFEAVDFLAQWLKPDHRVFEYGGGGSTLFFCKRAGFVATVEHDAGWFKLLEEKTQAKGFRNWEGHAVEPVKVDNMPEYSISSADHYVSGDVSFKGYSFEQYVKTIAQYPAESFDLVLVDGRARPSCAKFAIPYLKKGGLLVLDNAERDYYHTELQPIFDQQFKVLLKRRAPVAYTPGFTITMILEKQ